MTDSYWIMVKLRVSASPAPAIGAAFDLEDEKVDLKHRQAATKRTCRVLADVSVLPFNEVLRLARLARENSSTAIVENGESHAKT